MDVSDSTLRREIQSAKQLLKEKEDQHVRELDALSESHKGQIRDLDQSQQKNVEHLKKDSDVKLADTRARFDDALESSQDRFERTIQDERRTNYDKFGKLSSEYAKQRNRDDSLKARQMQDVTDSRKYDVEHERKQHEKTLETITGHFERDKAALKTGFDHSLEEQNRASIENLARVNQDARDRGDTNIRRTRDDFSKQKLGAELRYEKLVKDSQAERDDLKLSTDLRETQLANDKTLLEKQLTQGNAKSYEEYRRRASDSLIQTVNDSNYQMAEKERNNADMLARSEHGHRIAEQDLKSNFKKSETELKYKNMAEADRNRLKESQDERRHKQENYQSSETIRKNYDQSFQELKEGYNEKMRATDEKYTAQMENQLGNVRRQTSSQQNSNDADLTMLQMEKNKEVSELNQKNRQEKTALLKSYQKEQQAAEDLRQRQTSDQRMYYGGEVTKTKQDADRRVFELSRDTQGRLYQAQETLRNRTTEMEEARRNDLNVADSMAQSRMKRLTDNYNKATISQKELYDESTSELRHDNMLRMSKFSGDAEHDKRMQLIELQGKNRQIMASFDSKINQIKDDHTVVLEKLKADNDKALRDVLKKTKETMDAERSIHMHELEAKENQMKEKLRLQEEAFKEQIEKIKRTNELSIKKS